MAVNGAWIASAASTAVSAYSTYDSNQNAKDARRDAARARKKAEEDASNKANARLLMQRQAMQDNNLLTGGGRETLGV